MPHTPAQSSPTPDKILAIPGMISVLATFAAVISSLSLLMPASPAWVATGGAGSLGAGSVTAVLMAATVITQLFVVRWALAKFGWTATMVCGTVLMGIASPVQAIAPNLPLVLASSVARGVGFGLLTVCGAASLSILVPVEKRGRAVGVYGMAAAIPQLILTPIGPTLIEHLGFRFVLCSGVIAVIGVPFALQLGRLVEEKLATANTGGLDEPASFAGTLRLIWPALLTLTLVTAAGGAFMTFAIDLAPTPFWASIALFCMAAMATPTRLLGGTFSDKLGTRAIMTPLLAVAAFGAPAVGWAGGDSVLILLLGALAVGAGYGFLQSVTMVRALNDAGPANTESASAAWNANFDIGTGLGGLVVGALA